MVTREQMHSATQEIVRSYEDRTSGEAERKRTAAQEIAQRRSDVSTMLKGFDDAHAAMSKEMGANLAKGEQERRQLAAEELRQRKAAEEERRKTTAQEISQRKSNVSAMLKDFDEAHAAMSKEMGANLAKGEQERRQLAAEELRQRKAAEEERCKTTAQEISQRKSNVSAMLKGFREEQAGVRDEWQNMVATLQAKRTGAVLTKEVPAREEGEETAEFISLSKRAFEHLAEHPDGSRLVEMERGFGVSRIQMFRVVKKLINEGKVEKRELHYFAV